VEGLFLGGSVVAAFVAGAIALFAPCCILVVFPSYLAAAVRNQRWRLVPLTAVFTAGLALVLVPVALGVSLLASSLMRYHGPVYVVGGVLLFALAGLALSGRTWSLPFLRSSPDVQRTDSGGVFALGVFSGAASACCAPVLAGVLALTAVAPGMTATVMIALAYVLGMVAPLVVLTLAWDRSGLGERLTGRDRLVSVEVGRWRTALPLLDAIAAGIFAAMGGLLVAIGLTGTTLAPSFQVGAGSWLRDRLEPVVVALEPIPDWAAGLVLLGLGTAALLASAGGRRPDPDVDDLPSPPEPEFATTSASSTDPARHEHEHTTHCH
jgi:cytochrome c-type biogenesis protein